MLTLYDNCVECIEALGLKATYYGREAGGKTLALYDTDPPINDANGIYSCQVNYTEIWLDDWYVYGSEADGRIATVDPKEVIAVNGSRMTGSEFPHPLNEYNSSPPPSTLLPAAMKKTNISGVTGTYQTQQRIPDFRRYEIKDHLGNVRTVISDVKNPELTAPPISAWKYLADVKNISNMYPYGKSYGTNAIYNATDDYRYGFNGMEKAKEVDDNTLTSKYRIADLEFINWWSRDPEEARYPSFSPYSMMGTNPIVYFDPNGDDWYKNGNGNIRWFANSSKAFSTLDRQTWVSIGKELLSFNGSKLTYLWQTQKENGDYEINSEPFVAVSGRPVEIKNNIYVFDYSEDYQDEEYKGPIPEGLYYLNKDELQTISIGESIVGDIFGLFGIKGGTWPGGIMSWGNHRYWLYPDELTETYGRDDFSIHGGFIPGSAGCIDCVFNINDLVSRIKEMNKIIKNSSKSIYILVNYPNNNVNINEKNFSPKNGNDSKKAD